MKSFKKMLAIAIACIMMFALAVVTLADDQSTANYTITIGGAATGETYNAYKIFDATVSASGASYTIKNSNPWFGLLTTANSGFGYTASTDSTTGVITTTYFVFTPTASDPTVYTVSAVDGAGLLVNSGSAIDDATGLNGTAVANLAKMLDANKAGKTIAGTAVGAATTQISVTGAGYYFVDTSLGSICSLDTVSDVTINEKNSVPTPGKTTAEASKDAQIGDTVTFDITYTDGTGTDAQAILTDTMSDGLTLNASSFSAKVTGTVNGTAVTNQALTAGTDYTVNTTPAAGDTWTFRITLPAAYVASLDAGAVVTFTYTATVNENATYTAAEENKLTLTYSNQTSDEVEDTVTTYKFEVYKHATGEIANLDGAVFELRDGSDNVVNLVKLSDTSYRVATAAEAAAAASVATHQEGATVNNNSVCSDFITVDSGNIVIDGVDCDVTYSLVELEAPAGYNVLTAPVTVNVAADNSTEIDVANNAGTELPSTGGIGTTIFYVIGAVLVVGATVILVTRRRMGSEK
ncbi:MAG: SpaH/EbpB family LPXTG-anchored major pilin [Clostridia bacterium]|nr:SpaH/EbpB family LPXTG-anchored major pilin [Clostridia bacterium]